MSILVIAEHNNASIKPATLVAVAAAQAIGGEHRCGIQPYSCSHYDLR